MLWIQIPIRIGSRFNDFVDPDPYPNPDWAKMLDTYPDPDWAKMLDPYPDPDWVKMLNPYPDWSQSGSTTLVETMFLVNFFLLLLSDIWRKYAEP
jgi:hypothetical protein